MKGNAMIWDGHMVKARYFMHLINLLIRDNSKKESVSEENSP